MKLAFMSSVCPKMTLPELLTAGQAGGYEGIEFRPEWDQAHGIELESSAAQRKETAKIQADSPLEGCCLSPGVKFCSDQKDQRDANMRTLFEFVALAVEVGIGRMRIFGDPIPNDGRRAACYQYQAEYLLRAAEHAAEAGVALVMETHGNLRGFDMGQLLYMTGYPKGLWVNWHLGHCLRHGEDVDESYRHVKGRVAHVHFNLAEDETEWAHMARQVALLKDEGYSQFFSVEVINPEDSQAVLKRHGDGWKDLRRKVGF